MISGAKIRIDLAFRTAAAALALACCSLPALAFDLPDLMAQLSQKKSGQAKFVEKRDVKGLDKPVVASGTLSFTAPDRFVRQTLSPKPETLDVDGNNLKMIRGSDTHVAKLDSSPEAVGIISAMRGTLAGDASVLQHYFHTSLSGTADAWTLDLVPIDWRFARAVKSMRMTGRGPDLLGMEMQFASGDHSVMTITPLPAGAANP